MLERAGRDEEAPLIEDDYLERLRLYLGPEAFAELLADGLIEVADRLERLKELARALDGPAPDLPAIERFAHDLVGLAGNVGLARLARAAAELQRAARKGPAQGLEGLLARTLAAGREGEDALRALLAGPARP